MAADLEPKMKGFPMHLDSSNICASLETDQLYHLWGFVNSDFHGTNIHALSKERITTLNVISLNSKHRISAAKEMANAKMRRKMGIVYTRGGIKLERLKIGHQNYYLIKTKSDYGTVLTTFCF
ncbi:hypothetical protein BCR42DRAFT_431318 [Absidia repens]|uniref:Uncharacterized protein n=1 Tax=Absidia repens TaxID=90262 RepID=A0A1X2J1J1_9FUNG|nr:hypothetical protein BCR42DRAFT_431318 [Absidia repens]